MNSFICQSCGMPMEDEKLFGTDAQGQKIVEYCCYCYTSGEFTAPNWNVQAMIDFCVPIMVQDGMQEENARMMLEQLLPNLKRWRQADAEGAASELLIQPDRIEMVPELTICGIAARTTNAQEMTDTAEIPKLWSRMHQENITEQLRPFGASDAMYGCYCDYESDASGSYTIVVGHAVQQGEALPQEMTKTALPAARYAVFTSARGPISKIVADVWKDIWVWSATADVERTFTGDFELYDERCANPEDAVVDVYIAIR